MDKEQSRVDGELELTPEEIAKELGYSNTAYFDDRFIQVSQAQIRKCQPIIMRQVAREIIRVLEMLINEPHEAPELEQALIRYIQALKSRYVKEEG